jgi:hypothetical protein
MLAPDFKRRLGRLGLPRREAAAALGLSLDGLFHQLRGDRPISRQTELLLDCLERHRHVQRGDLPPVPLPPSRR